MWFCSFSVSRGVLTAIPEASHSTGSKSRTKKSANKRAISRASSSKVSASRKRSKKKLRRASSDPLSAARSKSTRKSKAKPNPKKEKAWFGLEVEQFDRTSFGGRLITNVWFEHLILLLVLLNTVVLAMYYHGMSHGYANFLSTLHRFFLLTCVCALCFHFERDCDWAVSCVRIKYATRYNWFLARLRADGTHVKNTARMCFLFPAGAQLWLNSVLRGNKMCDTF